MFKRSDQDESRAEPTVGGDPMPIAKPPAKGEHAAIGPSIRIKGDLAGDEDLVIQGQVEGTVSLPDNLLTVGSSGQLNATVSARVIDVEGRVEGDLNGQEQVVLRRAGNVRGNIVAPRVTLEDGCHFKGSIDMDAKPAGAQQAGFGNAKVADLKTASGATSGAATVSPSGASQDEPMGPRT
jgi:cytoskeletal protein CcmA (bactofilin family)